MTYSKIRAETSWLVMAAIIVVPFFTSHAAAQAIAEFAITTGASAPLEITAGPDGAMWFTENNGNKIGRITTAAAPAVTEFVVTTAASGPSGIIAGPDGNLWFTENTAGKIGQITTAGTITEFALPTANSGPQAITVGSDGNLWFTEQAGGRIGKISPGGALVEFNLPNAGSMPLAIRPGADGALWFTETGTNRIGRITTSGAISEFANPNGAAQPSFIAPYPNGGLAFTESGTDQVALIDLNGNFEGEASFPTAGGGAGYIALGPDGGLWFTESKANKIARLVLTANAPTFREYAVPTASSNVTTVSAGPDGNLWFTEQGANKIGRLTPPTTTTPLVAAVLPGSRSVQTAHQATAFATIINSGSAALNNCGIVPLSPIGAALGFQTTDPITNGLSGTSNTRVTIPAGAYQTYFFSLLPGGTQAPTNVALGFDCDGVDPAQPIIGVNTLLFAASATAIPDLVALGATPSQDGILNISGNNGNAAFAVATVNVGAPGPLTAFVDSGSTAINATFLVCETNPTTGACVPAGSAHQTYGPFYADSGDTPTFSIFVTATGPIPFAPATNRIFVRFKDQFNVTRGSTSVAVRTQ